MRNILSIIAGCLIVLASLECIKVGVCLARAESNREMIQQTNERMAEMFYEMQAPCATLDFVILEEQ